MMTSPSRCVSRFYRVALAAAAVVAIAATAAIGAGARSWIGAPFPGFFVLANRVIPSVGLTSWSGTRDGAVYQRAVIAIDGSPVASASDVYLRVANHAPGHAFTYTLRRGTTTETLALASHRFSQVDYSMIFGAYLMNGIFYLLLGLLAAWMLPDTDLGRAVLFVGCVAGIFALSAVSLYGPESEMRVHALAEAFFPATLVYLAVVFPREHSWLIGPVAGLGWWLSLALAVPYQILIEQPAAYSLLHAACEAYLGLAGIGLVTSLLVERARAGEAATPLLRAALAGALLGLGVPAVVMTLSGLTGGGIPVNVAATTGFLFPACFAFGLVRQDVATRRRAVAASLA
ncbi:MAG: hypothetical protein HY271_21545 [Deltaproteobacteria bacterium]|nr:hypothetical protein [Deltaproteobacteria bacterium]